MKDFIFTRKVIYKEIGVVTANSEEEALKKVKNDEYEDIFNCCIEEVIKDSEEIEEEA